MSKLYNYEPDYTVHPGEIVEHYMEQEDCSKTDFSKKIGWSVEFLDALLNAKIAVTKDMAKQLSIATGTSVQIWLNLQKNYEKDTIRLKKYKQKEKVVTEYHHNTVLTPLTAKA
jgi:addiction module HigA family antidote